MDFRSDCREIGGSHGGLEFKTAIKIPFNVKILSPRIVFEKRSRPQKVLNLAGASKMSDGSGIKADSNRLNIYCLVVQYIGILWIVGLFSRGKRPRIVLCWTLST